MFEPKYDSELLQQAVEAFQRLPGVGAKGALRMALHLLRRDPSEAQQLANSIVALRTRVVYCSECGMISDAPVCPICAAPKRNHGLVCVVENVRDVMSIEQTGRYNGLYHVLGGIISPIDGIGPADLTIDALVQRVKSGTVREIILAISTTMEGETTCYYLYRMLSPMGVGISTIARGVGFGDQLEYTDQITLGRSIENRQPFKPV